MSETVGGTDAVALFDTSSLALGTLTAGDGFPAAGTPPSSSLVCATELSKIPDPEAFLSAHARAADVSCTCRHCASAIPAADVAATLKLMDGRELLFGKGAFRRLHTPAKLQPGSDGKTVAGALSAGGGPSVSPGASLGSSASAAADRGAAEMMLRPDEIAWPLPFADAALYGLARGLMAWHYKHKFCGVCAAPLFAREGGAKKQCSNAACGVSLYPRVDPVVITLIRSADNSRVLLGRQPGFPPGWYSCLAGYAENGESLEDAARREVHEESGMRLSDVRYHSSQPWPIGRGTYGQLMVGFVGTAHSDAPEALVVDRTELEDARWFGREEVAAAVAAHFIERAPRSEGAGGGRGRAASPTPASGAGTAAAATVDASTYSTPSTTSAPDADVPSVTGSTAVAQAEAGALPGAPGAPEGASPARGQALRVPGPYAIAHVLLQAWLRGEC
jgi:NADH pyrophosphatase NudC (nudix superfamily)